MTERLIIQNFAGLNLDIELGRVNIFIGPQASGKSVTAKCLYWFKAFANELFSFAGVSKSKKQFDEEFLSKFKSYFPNIWRSKKQFTLRYELADAYVMLIGKNNALYLSYSLLYHEALEISRVLFQQIKKESGKTTRLISHRPAFYDDFSQADLMESIDSARDELVTRLGVNAFGYQSFVLAGRSFFSALKGAVLTFLSSTNLADPFLRDFIQAYERDRGLYYELTLSKTIANLVSNVIKGEVSLDGDEDYIISQDGRKVSIANASSGQQEAFPLVLILLSFLWQSGFAELASSLQVLYIEEPEAHLFSESQRAMAQLMSAVYNKSTYPLELVITTHSPYLLASFNNLVYAHQLAETLRDQPGELKKLYAIVPKSQQLPLADFRVYGFENGGVRSLIDQETGLISADLLDSASDVISNQFDELMRLEPTTKR